MGKWRGKNYSKLRQIMLTNEFILFVCYLATHSIINVFDIGVSNELEVKVLVELFGVICSKSSL